MSTDAFTASNGWQFKIEDGTFYHRFGDDERWTLTGRQVALGLIEWAQTDYWNGGTA